MNEDQIELVTRFLWERVCPDAYASIPDEAKRLARDSVRQLDIEMTQRFYDAIEFGRKLGAEK